MFVSLLSFFHHARESKIRARGDRIRSFSRARWLDTRSHRRRIQTRSRSVLEAQGIHQETSQLHQEYVQNTARVRLFLLLSSPFRLAYTFFRDNFVSTDHHNHLTYAVLFVHIKDQDLKRALLFRQHLEHSSWIPSVLTMRPISLRERWWPALRSPTTTRRSLSSLYPASTQLYVSPLLPNHELPLSSSVISELINRLLILPQAVCCWLDHTPLRYCSDR